MSELERKKRPAQILIADDDPDDCLLIREAFAESQVNGELRFVHDGEELLDYLLHRSNYGDAQRYPAPCLILMDLNMPLMDGREALRQIKQHPQLRHIPLVVLTTSSAVEDISLSYASGANSFITKPVTYSGLLAMVEVLGRYWCDLVALPAPLGGELL